MGYFQKEFTIEDENYIKIIGKNIVAKRIAMGISQIELATNCNIEDSALRRIEKGRSNSTVKTLLNIARGLNVDLKDLLPSEKEIKAENKKRQE